MRRVVFFAIAASIALAVVATASERPAREYAKVTFRDPVWIGDKVLMGTYVIEHDADRMARGVPCTHIYSIDRPDRPIVAFHCKHLRRAPTERATVTLRRARERAATGYLLTEFQFAGATDGHGVPGIR